MTTIPEPIHTTANQIYKWYESKSEGHREHLGASLIGHECDRFLWLTFRWAASPNFEGRVLRLFGTGKREEQRVYEELRAIGVELHTEQNGQQINCRDDSGHFGGSVDGIGRGFAEGPKTWAVLEIKTANFSASKKLKDSGVEAGQAPALCPDDDLHGYDETGQGALSEHQQKHGRNLHGMGALQSGRF
jgi:hypothetical protein